MHLTACQINTITITNPEENFIKSVYCWVMILHVKNCAQVNSNGWNVWIEDYLAKPLIVFAKYQNKPLGMKYSKCSKKNLKQKRLYYGDILMLHTDSAVIMTARCKFVLKIHLENSEDLVTHYFTKDLS